MLTILFFGQLRERLQTERLRIDIAALNANPCVSDLKSFLANKGPLWAELISSEHCLVAVNRTMASPDSPLASLDEIALFPPVTGG